MRFKAMIDTLSIFHMFMLILFPAFLAVHFFNAENTVFFVGFTALAVLVAIVVVIDIVSASYVFEDDYLFIKFLIGREKVAYTQIQSFGTRERNGKMDIYLGVGRRYPHKVRAKDKEGFLAELRRRRPDLPEEK
ncbi:MAG: hypothetical protein LBE35_07250 [Clostridiales bacterium]|jgi:hypothetical protein|nr:hypothetical protein [Clostridiales bacterium]